jgi:gliding motility-associated-like protein
LKKLFLIAWGLWSAICYSQNLTITVESPNYYLKVDETYAGGIRITETMPGQLNKFMPGDKVLVIQMTGVTIDSSDADFKTLQARTRGTIGNTGKFEILQVDEISIGSDTIIYFTDNLTNSYDNLEKIQAVKVVEGETVTISGNVSCKPWDGKVGGILAIIGIDTVKFADNSVLDVSGKGFRGGSAPDENYINGCRSGNSAVLDTIYFLPEQSGRSGNKGEGIITTQWPYTKGTGFNINGGGAGNGQFAGGGGGSNGNTGGDGGYQSYLCLPDSVFGGWGGYSCIDLYTDNYSPRAILGGGGGSGNRLNASSASNGGNGGGLAIIITGTLVSGTSAAIHANGDNASPISTFSSGAGGGGGGTVLLDATTYLGSQLSVQALGGDGSSSLTNGYGAGGSGSGGIIWHSGLTLTAATDESSGIPGTTGSPLTYLDQNGRNGNIGYTLNDIILPLTGFLFNSVKGIDTICQTQVPAMLNASQPKGGNGLYSHVWQQSNDNIAWVPAVGSSTLRTLQPIALNQTTFYRRIVSSENPVTAEPIQDTSRVVKILVYPSISNNSVLGTDTICTGGNPAMLTGIALPVAGGNGTYSYKWEESIDLASWNIAGTLANFDPDVLDANTWYRRIVTSSYCTHTSNVIPITVLSSISQNIFSTSDTAVCENSSPGRLRIGFPAGGDGTYNYLWQSKSGVGVWTDIPATSDSARYTVGILNDTVSFRRIVYSGNDHACTDTSASKQIIIRPLISKNSIIGSTVQYTCYNAPVSLTGSTPENGFGDYAYAWEESDDNSLWNSTTGTEINYQSSNLTNTKFFRRTVFSSLQNHECSNTSDAVEIRINPLPVANVIDSKDTLCAGTTLFVKFNVAGNGPFNVAISGGPDVGQSSKNGVIGPIDSISFTPSITQPFTMVSVVDNNLCAADADGFIPVVPATIYSVPVVFAGDDAEVCGNNFIMQASKSNALFDGFWTADNAVFNEISLDKSPVSVSNYGPKVFTWTELNWQCMDEDDVVVTFYEEPQPADAGPDQELDFNYTTQLEAVPASVGIGKWTVSSGDGEFSDDTHADAIVSELSDIATLKWTVINGTCPAVEDSMKITIKPLIIKKGFTPNGDTRNEEFDFGAINAENISVKIFNSAGVLVFESENYLEDEKWKGYNMNGVKLPEGTYFYVANIKVAGKTKEVQFRSFVEIMR